MLDGRLHPPCRLAEYLRTGGHCAQVHQLQALALYLLNHHRENLLLRRLVLGQEHESRAVLSLLWHGDALQQDELMRYLEQDTRAVARLVARLGTTVLHVLQHLQRLVHQFVALAAVDVHHHAYATGVVLILWLI